jgi:hypothetical protein
MYRHTRNCNVKKYAPRNTNPTTVGVGSMCGSFNSEFGPYGGKIINHPINESASSNMTGDI